MRAEYVAGNLGVRLCLLIRTQLVAMAAAMLWASAADAEQLAAGSDSPGFTAVEYRDVDLTYAAEATVEAVSEATVAAQDQ